MRTTSSLFTLLSVALAAVNASVIESRATTCNANDVSWVNARITHPVYFCTWYLSDSRTASPLTILSASQLKSACSCITSTSTKQTLTTVTTSPSSSVCGASDTAVISHEYKNPQGFCSFWTSAPRSSSCIPGKSVSQINQGCKCLSATISTQKPSTTSTATKWVTSTVKKVAITTTSTCSKNPLATNIGNFASGLKSWTATTTGSATYATGSSYDTSGSAAKLSCTYATSDDTRVSLVSPQMSTCAGQTYTVSFRYKWTTGKIGGILNLYDYGWSELLGSIEGPESVSGCDEEGVEAGAWALYQKSFVAKGDGDVVLVALECLSGDMKKGVQAQVTIDNVRYTRS